MNYNKNTAMPELVDEVDVVLDSVEGMVFRRNVVAKVSTL